MEKSNKAKLNTEFCKMTIRHHIEQRELRERDERAEAYSESVEDRCFLKATIEFFVAMALIINATYLLWRWLL